MIRDPSRVAWATVAAVVPALAATGQTQFWIRQLGTGANDYAAALGSDGGDGAFFAISVPGGIGPVASPDIRLTRFDGAGNQVWSTLIGTTEEDYAEALAPDGADGMFAAGATRGDFGGLNLGLYDAWLGRYDGSGRQVWLRQVGTLWHDWAHALAPDNAGGLFIAGMTDGRLAWSKGENADVWVGRYDGAGGLVWIRQFGSQGGDVAYALAPDGVGGAFVAGLTGDDLVVGAADAWIAHYDSAATQTWLRQFGTSGGDGAFALAPDGAGGTYIAGYTDGSLGGPAAGGLDAWLARYDPTGNQQWIRQLGTSDSEQASALASDGAGGTYIAGYTYGSLGAPNAGPPETSDVWLVRYDGAGNVVEMRQFGTPFQDEAGLLAPDGRGGAFGAGATTGSLGGPNAGSSKTYDAWLGRFGPGFVDCYADCNTDDSLTVADFGCFQTKFVVGDPYADCDADGQLTLADFACFQAKFAAGCP